MVISVLLAGVLAAWAVSTLHPLTHAPPEVAFSPSIFGDDPAPDPEPEPDPLAEVLDALRDVEPFEWFLEMLTWAAAELDTAQATALASAIHAELPQERARLASVLLESIRAGKDEPSNALVNLASAEPPIPHANYALGQFYLSRRRLEEAAAAFEREARRPDAGRARDLVVHVYTILGDEEALRRLEADPSYAKHFDGWTRAESAARRGEWWRLFLMIPAAEYQRVELRYAVLAAMAAAVWLVFLLQAGQVPGPRSAGFALCLLAVVAGVLSIWPTVFAIYWQEEVWGLEESSELGPGLAFFIAGVGLREEVCKLLLFLPFVPVLVKRGNELEMLIVAGCVGLGFAAEENIGYFNISTGASIARFLTANFFHITMTGLIGLAICRAFKWPHEFLNDLPLVFVTVVVAHGMYDALISLPDLNDYSILAMTVYILLSYQFFGQLRGLRRPSHEVISLTATFLFGFASIVAITFVYLTYDFGMKPAADLLVFEMVGVGLIVIMFLREVPEPVG